MITNEYIKVAAELLELRAEGLALLRRAEEMREERWPTRPRSNPSAWAAAPERAMPEPAPIAATTDNAAEPEPVDIEPPYVEPDLDAAPDFWDEPEPEPIASDFGWRPNYNDDEPRRSGWRPS